MPDFGAVLAERRRVWPWLDHVFRAAGRYQERKSDFAAAAITYFSILAIVPVLMIGFSVAGFVLVSRPDLLTELRDHITSAVPGSFGTTITDLVDTAIRSRTQVGVLGLLGALYAGLGWVANLREGLSTAWDAESEPANFLRTKLSDLVAMLGLAAAVAVSLGLSALGSGPVTRALLTALGVQNVIGVGVLVRVVAIAVALGSTFVLLVFVIARLPRVPVPLRAAVGGAAIGAVAFEVFKQLGAFYLEVVTRGPAGTVFGPVIGILVFVYSASRMLLFCATWAATIDRENISEK